MKLLVKPNPPYFVGFWCNKYCCGMVNGSIHNYLKELDSDKTLAMVFGDGFLDNDPAYMCYEDGVKVGATCSRNCGKPDAVVYLPFDDDVFEHGLAFVLERDIPNVRIPWEERMSKVYWRGNGNMHSSHNPRRDAVRILHQNPHADVKFIRTPDTREEDYTTEYFEPRYTGGYQSIPMTEFVQHKYLLSIDAMICPSAIQWLFGSGSVPIFIHHPDNRFWFQPFLKPMVNYVPVKYDCSDLASTLEYLLQHDDHAKTIAQNAYQLSQTIFTSEFQKQYLRQQLT